LEEIGGHPLTQYNLTISNPSSLGFSSAEGDVIPNRIRDIVLAINLTLKEVALSPVRLDLTQPIWSTNEGIKEQKNVILGMGGAAEQLDESDVMSNLQLIDKLDRHKRKRRKRTQKNLENALGNYESAFYRKGIKELDEISMFKSIFNAVEIAINWEKELCSPDRDKILSNVANVSIRRVASWRCMYNRLKHTSISLREQRQYRNMMQGQIRRHLVPLRSASNAVLLDRLQKI
jgi:hypothetical protein